jgi:stage V sporulation protein G
MLIPTNSSCHSITERQKLRPMTDSVPVTVTILDMQPVHRGRLLALATVEVEIEGVVFVINGVQLTRITNPKEGAAVDLPRYRDAAGEWRQAITLPDELRGPIGDAVREKSLELGITKPALAV